MWTPPANHVDPSLRTATTATTPPRLAADLGARVAKKQKRLQKQHAHDSERLSTDAPLLLRDDAVVEVRDLLAAAETFERGFDFSAAHARARDAAALVARLPPPTDADGIAAATELTEEVEIERKRFAAREKTWRAEVDARSATFYARETAEA
jgi:hypothetical protein